MVAVHQHTAFLRMKRFDRGQYLVDRGAEEWVHFAARCVMHREFASHQVVVEGAGRGAERDHRAIWMVGEEPGHGMQVGEKQPRGNFSGAE